MPINTGPYGKSAAGMAGAPISGMAEANAPLASRVAGQSMNRRPMAPMRRPQPMRRPTMAPQAPMGRGLGFNPGKSMPGTMQGPVYNGPLGSPAAVAPPMGGGGPMNRVQADPLMAADQGPVAQTAPPMFQPPQGPMGGGQDLGMMEQAGGGSPLLAKYLQGQQDPRFRY